MVGKSEQSYHHRDQVPISVPQHWKASPSMVDDLWRLHPWSLPTICRRLTLLEGLFSPEGVTALLTAYITPGEAVRILQISGTSWNLWVLFTFWTLLVSSIYYILFFKKDLCACVPVCDFEHVLAAAIMRRSENNVSIRSSSSTMCETGGLVFFADAYARPAGPWFSRDSPVSISIL